MLSEKYPMSIGIVSTRYSPIANLRLLETDKPSTEPVILPFTISCGSFTSILTASTQPSNTSIRMCCLSVGLSNKSPLCFGEYPSFNRLSGIAPIV